MITRKFRYIRKLHLELRRAAPEGYNIAVTKQGRALLTTIHCDDANYFAPWLVREIVEPFGFTFVTA